MTIGALIGMAAHLEGKGVTVLDMTGLAQKGGAVLSHVRIAERPEAIHAVRIAAGGARLLLGCDLGGVGERRSALQASSGHSRAIVNSHETITGDFTRNPDLPFPGRDLRGAIAAALGDGDAEFIEATRLATGLFGDSIATNLFMLGYAYQQGLVPVTADAIERAIELNGVAVAFNRGAFQWGRRAAFDRASVEARADPEGCVAGESPAVGDARRDDPAPRRISDPVPERRLCRALRRPDPAGARSGGAPWRRDFADRGGRPRAVQGDGLQGRIRSCPALHRDATFSKRVADQFEGSYRLRFHLAPPLLADRDPTTGHLKKRVYGSWMLAAFRLLAGLRFLRGTSFDPFGRTADRKAERRLLAEYEARLDRISRGLSPENHATAVELARLPLEIRGFGHIKEANLKRAKAKEAELLARFGSPSAPHALAAE